MKIVAHSTCGAAADFRADFCALPQHVRTAPYRTGMLRPETCELFFDAAYPAPCEFWTAYAGGSPVGRICASVSAARPDTGFFGLLEFDPACADAGSRLLSAAGDWLGRRGVSQAIGPVAFNTWFPYRLRLPDDDERRFEWEPVNPPEYVEAVAAAGYEPGEKYSSVAFRGAEAVAASFEADYARARADGYDFQPIDMDEPGDDVAALYRISHAAFRDNYLFEPISPALFAKAYLTTAKRRRAVLAWFVLDQRGEEVGFLYTFVDTCVAAGITETAAVLKSIAIVPGHRGRGLSNALLRLALVEYSARGADYAISALVQAGARSEACARRAAGLWRHEYALWRKELR